MPVQHDLPARADPRCLAFHAHRRPSHPHTRRILCPKVDVEIKFDVVVLGLGILHWFPRDPTGLGCTPITPSPFVVGLGRRSYAELSEPAKNTLDEGGCVGCRRGHLQRAWSRTCSQASSSWLVNTTRFFVSPTTRGFRSVGRSRSSTSARISASASPMRPAYERPWPPSPATLPLGAVGAGAPWSITTLS